MMTARNPGVKSISIDLNSQSEYHSSNRRKEANRTSTKGKKPTTQTSDQIKKLPSASRKSGTTKEIKSIQSKGLASNHS